MRIRMLWALFLDLVARVLAESAEVQGGDYALENPTEALECLEVTGPVLSSRGLVDGRDLLGEPARGEAGGRGRGRGRGRERESCVVRLMEHVFANSYGRPFVANYVPPSPSSCLLASTFNRVVVNFTVVSEGRQFDRLATMWLNDTEVWRTSTAEPKPHPGISWTYWKDMTHYLALWKQPQTLIFDLGNLINDKYTGSFNATLTATYLRLESKKTENHAAYAIPADQILPISAGRGTSHAASAWVYPDEEAQTYISLPHNVKRAVVSLAATGQADEEFWWSNVPEASKDMFNGTTLPGKGSFREVRLYIDGKIAGLSWPFPVVFTGGISPPLHRPIVGIQAFDLREQEIDVTPWLGVLCDGHAHHFRLEVVGADDVVPNRYWLLSGKIFLWLLNEAPGHVTTGPAPSISVNKPDYMPHDTSVRGKHVRYDQTLQRKLAIRSTIMAGSHLIDATWTQAFTMRNQGVVLAAGRFQNVTASYQGRDVATQNGLAVYQARYSYPLLSSSRQTAPDGNYSLTLEANLTQSLDLMVSGKAVFPNGLEAFLPFLGGNVSQARVSTTKSGSAFFWQRDGGKTSGGSGSSHQRYVLLSTKDAEDAEMEDKGISFGMQISMPRRRSGQLYWRDIRVVNETRTRDARWVYGGVDLAGMAQAVDVDSAVVHRVDDDRANTFAARLLGGEGVRKKGVLSGRMLPEELRRDRP
ncbi:hypothetical protein E4U60_003536 [Claviceps pazoutovae]|uniref:Peptide N-acetyl-beta-D-glucosaminyl asparaginase amidase A N-terminal domain-containing protein n=1 Tax=Claviceps pazoutovae TaxID=1649127 RepID=A0A9P7M9X8_9HYPO|nr:hypothetical protein E4U60_003536 [Claviceps pazoutovae]